jgi:putative hydrolase of the HAD superfamily
MRSLPDPALVDAVVFDAGGVLVLPDLVAGKRVLQPLGCDPMDSDWIRAHYASVAAFDSMEAPDWPALRRCFASHAGVADDRLEAAVPLIDALIVSTPWMAIPDAATTLRTLSSAGYKLGVISNAFGTVEADLGAAGICSTTDRTLPRVEIIVDSHVVGIEKPDPRIFHLALDALGVGPERTVFVGDSVRCDVKGAMAAGMHAVHLDPVSSCSGGHSDIESLGDLLDWLA